MKKERLGPPEEKLRQRECKRREIGTENERANGSGRPLISEAPGDDIGCCQDPEGP